MQELYSFLILTGPSHRIRLLSRRGVHVLTILLIADQDRLEKLFDFVRDTPQIRFRVSRSLRQGIQEITEETPDILFVQSHLSGLSGEIIARHLLEQVEGTRPRVILFGETGQPLSPQATLDACLDIARTDEELTAAIIGIIADTPSPPPVVEAPPTTVQQAPAPVGNELPSHSPASPGATPPPPEPPIPATDTVEDLFDRNTPPAPASLATSFDQKLKTVIEQVPEPVPLTELEETVSFTGATTEPSLPLGRRHVAAARKKNRSPLLWIGAAAIAVVAVGAALLLRSPTVPPSGESLKPGAPAAVRPAAENVTRSLAPASQEPSAPVAPTAPPATGQAQPSPPQTAPAAKPTEPPAATAKGLAQLPPFIPREGLDRDYGTSHPGWERYRGVRTEFKVYRDGTAIRAIQAIDRSGVGIPESFFRGALGQMTNSREFTLEAKETQGKFRVEKGSTPGGARLVIYRTVPKGAIRAFVVHFN